MKQGFSKRRDSQNAGILKTQGFSKRRDFQNPGILKTQGFSKPRDSQNAGIIKTQGFLNSGMKNPGKKILRDKKSSD